MTNPFINSGGRLRNGWWIALFFVVLTVLLLPLILFARAEEAPVPIWQQALVVAGASLLCQAARRRPIAELVGPLGRTWLQQLLLGAVLGAALMLVPAGALWLLGAIRWAPSGEGASALLDVFLLFAAVAVTEELLFRGFIFQRAIAGIGAWPAQVLISALFLLTHSDALHSAGAVGVLGAINIFVASLMFGWAFIRTRSLAMPIGIHFAANFVQGGLLGLGVSGSDQQGLLAPTLSGPDWLTGGAFGLEASAPGLVSVAALAILIYRWRATERSGAALHLQR